MAQDLLPHSHRRRLEEKELMCQVSESDSLRVHQIDPLLDGVDEHSEILHSAGQLEI